MARNARQLKILELISKKDIETQDELAAELKREHFPATQATISRDIKELGLVKVSDGKKQKYARDAADSNISAKLLNMFRHAVFSIDYALNNVVIKTISGAANSAGMFVDRSALPISGKSSLKVTPVSAAQREQTSAARPKLSATSM